MFSFVHPSPEKKMPTKTAKPTVKTPHVTVLEILDQIKKPIQENPHSVDPRAWVSRLHAETSAYICGSLTVAFRLLAKITLDKNDKELIAQEIFPLYKEIQHGDDSVSITFYRGMKMLKLKKLPPAASTPAEGWEPL